MLKSLRIWDHLEIGKIDEDPLGRVGDSGMMTLKV